MPNLNDTKLPLDDPYPLHAKALRLAEEAYAHHPRRRKVAWNELSTDTQVTYAHMVLAGLRASQRSNGRADDLLKADELRKRCLLKGVCRPGSPGCPNCEQADKLQRAVATGDSYPDTFADKMRDVARTVEPTCNANLAIRSHLFDGASMLDESRVEIERLRSECKDKAHVLKSALVQRHVQPYKLPILVQQVAEFLEKLGAGE